MTPGTPALRRGPGGWWIGRAARPPARGLALCVLMLAGVGLLLALAGAVVLAGLGPWLLLHDSGQHFLRSAVLALATACAALGIDRLLIPRILLAVRRLANLTRRLAGEWCGVPIGNPYRPLPATGKMTSWQLTRWLLTDPATRRDLQWLVLNAGVAWLLAAAPAVLAGVGLIEFIGPVAGPPFAIPPPAFAGNNSRVLVLIGIALITLGLSAAPRLLRGYGALARSMLAPPGEADLALRVRHLAQTRSETIDSGAAELRRIERDLHDGAQARLVAMGMTLDAAGQIIDENPAGARALLAEARESSVKALAELRDLVRGIHPPVLADRGLADAVRALALDSPLRVQLASELPGRPPPPVESAVYFAVSELLANVTKHAGAGQAWIDIRHSAGVLRAGVTDDGAGGADPARGTGLRGIERRVAAFDGVLALSSPPGGPTVVNLEIPCALSSPKTSSS